GRRPDEPRNEPACCLSSGRHLSPPSAWRNGLGEAIGAQTAPLAELSRAGSVDETPQPAANGAHSMAGMGPCRQGATSNSNSLAPLHSGVEQAPEARVEP